MIESANLHFADFAILSVLLSILYGITVVELAFRPPKRQSDVKILSMAAYIAFAGIIVTVIAGAAAEVLAGVRAELALPLVPIAFLITWAIQYYRSSRWADFEGLEKTIDAMYLGELRELVRRSEGPLTVEQTITQLRDAVPLEKIVSVVDTVIGSRPIAGKASFLLKPLALSPIRVKDLLRQLEQDGVISQRDGQVYLQERVTSIEVSRTN